MRLFTAIQLSDESRAHIRRVQGVLKDTLGISEITWVKPQHLHITLKFLGDVEDAQLVPLTDALAEVTVKEMKLFADRLDRFPKRGRIRVLAAAIGGDAAEVSLLFERVESAVGDLGIAREMRPFTPHITLGRSRRGEPHDHFQRASSEERLWPGPLFTVHGFDLVRSTLTSEGPIYETLTTFEGRFRGKMMSRVRIFHWPTEQTPNIVTIQTLNRDGGDFRRVQWGRIASRRDIGPDG